MKLVPYLTLDGTTREAFDFYARHLGGKVVSMMTFGQMPDCGEMPAPVRERIMHAAMSVGDQMLMASDAMPGEFEGNKGMAVSLHIDAPADAERVFAALSEGGQVTMAMESTFWAERFGMLVDRYGVSWIINCTGDRGDCVES